VKTSVAPFVTILAIVAMAAVGGAAVVFSEYDDSPGGQLIGFLLIIGALVIGMRTAQGRGQ
jgi:hypothetical protein